MFSNFKMVKGSIYCFKCLNSNLIYIGSTRQSLATRKAKHIYVVYYTIVKKNIELNQFIELY